MITGQDLLWFQHGDHVHPGGADAHRDEPGPRVRVQVRNLVVHDVTARFPERLTRNDFPGFFALQLKEDPALQDISEDRTRMAMRLESGVGRWEVDELCHRV